ncbi:MAG: hypothetical protein HN849_21060, partial [Victivallales bacterium]|nr:hypothetical protein [Victivallales bacterium]
MTVECFVRVEKQVARFALLVSKRRRSGSSWSLAVSPQGVVTVRFDTQGGASGPGFNRTVSGGARIDDGAWHHVALTFEHDTRECGLYVDYQLRKEATIGGPPGGCAQGRCTDGHRDPGGHTSGRRGPGGHRERRLRHHSLPGQLRMSPAGQLRPGSAEGG